MSSTIREQQQLPPLKRPRGFEHLLEGRVGIVTGASRGIGAATAVLLAASGAKLALAARDRDGLRRTEAIIKESGGSEVLVIPTDVTDGPSVEHLVKAALDKFGRLDFAFNDAGSGHMPRPLGEVPVEDFQSAIRTNVLGTFLSMKYEIAAMLKGGDGGSIVNMSSTAGLEAVNGIAGYVAGKHAVIGLT